MQIVTSGSAYIDIDAYAGCVAYAELLKMQGKDALAVSTAPLNESISKTVRSWKAPILFDYNSSKGDDFILIDVSDPEYFDDIVNLNNVIRVIDHHPGYEDYWQQKIGDYASIEFIGSACTLVYENWISAGLINKISPLSAKLLVCGILDNTLNFGAKVTTKRDITAYSELLKFANLKDDWMAQYFTECQESVLQDVVSAIKNDTKILTFKSFNKQVCFGQLVVWDGKHVLKTHQQVLQNVLASMNPNWFVNVVSVGEQKSYFYSNNSKVQKWLSSLLGLEFNNSIAIAERLWLRKEVIKQDINND